MHLLFRQFGLLRSRVLSRLSLHFPLYRNVIAALPKRYCLFPPKPCFRLPCGKLHLTRTHYFRRYPRIVIFSFANGLLPICRNVITALPKHYSLFSPKPCCRLLCGKLHLTWTHYFRRYPQNRHFLFAKGLLPLYRSVITALPKRYCRFPEAYHVFLCVGFPKCGFPRFSVGCLYGGSYPSYRLYLLYSLYPLYSGGVFRFALSAAGIHFKN